MSSSTDATRIIAFLPPNDALSDYEPLSPPGDQADTIPTAFRDAMTVRNEVFGQEQGIPMEYEWDEDDHRSSHWIMYSAPGGGTTEVKGRAIGTLRAVPFPHPPHPTSEGRYFEGEQGIHDQSSSPTQRLSPFVVDRATTFHDGQEAYIKLGRMSVLKKHRGKGVAKALTMTALEWLKKNPTYFNVTSRDRRDLTDGSMEEFGVWKGLVCVHAQEAASAVWAKCGFDLDQGMGRWYEAGIPHVGMFQRLDLEGETR